MSYVVPFEVEKWSYDKAMDTLKSALHFGIQPMLESVEDMLQELDNPDLAYHCIQIAGTNGKTSTARYTAAILMGEGLRTALYTSPELMEYPERIEIMGCPVSKDIFAHGICTAYMAGQRVNSRRIKNNLRPYDITEFDLLTVAALTLYAEAGINVAVLECGLGGRWDATSAAKSIKAVAVTGVGLDHTRILGDTLEKIAAEKAAIIKAGRSVVLGVGTATPYTVEDVFLKRCSLAGVKPVLVRPTEPNDAAAQLHNETPRVHGSYPLASYTIVRKPKRLGDSLILNLKVGDRQYKELSALKPAYQAPNIACALVLAQNYLGCPLNEEKLFDSIVSCPTPGRFDVRQASPLVLVDACHNPQSVATFLTAVRQIQPAVEKRPSLLVAVLKDKDVKAIVELLKDEFPKIICTQTTSSRALSADALAELFVAAGTHPYAVYTGVKEALLALKEKNEPCIACGSITLAGEISANIAHNCICQS